MAKPLTPEIAVQQIVRASDPQIAPDSTRFVYALSQVDPATKKDVRHLRMRAIDGSRPVQITWRGESNGCARWSPDGCWIAFVSDRPDSAPKGNGLYILPTDGPG